MKGQGMNVEVVGHEAVNVNKSTATRARVATLLAGIFSLVLASHPLQADEWKDYALVCLLAHESEATLTVSTKEGETEQRLKSNESTTQFIQKVADMMKEGWQPSGGVEVNALALGTVLFFCQTMVKD